MQSRLLLKQAIRTIKTTSTKSKTNIGNTNSSSSIRFPSVKVNTTTSHTMTNDIKLSAQSNGANKRKTKRFPSVSSDNDALETVTPYLRV